MAQERRRVTYSGRVQGVGFRFTARQLARGFAVSGYVRNLDDGRVELVVEGEAAEVDALLASVRREMEGKIRDVDERQERPGDPVLTGFEVRY